MSDFEKNPLNQDPQQPAAPESQPAPQEAAAPAPQAEPTPAEPAYEKPTPHLTLEPDLPPDPPAYEAGPARPMGDPFQMPPPPRAPEPEVSHPQGHQSPEPPYQPPQYQPPQYQYQASQQTYYPNYTPQYNTPPVGYAQKSRLAAGLLAIMLGVFGVHSFYLGFNTRGTIQLVLSLAGGLLTCGVATVAVAIWAFIEGVMLLSAQPSRMYDGNNVILRD